MRRLLLFFILIPLAGCGVIQSRIQGILGASLAPTITPESTIPQAYPPPATQVLTLPLVVVPGTPDLGSATETPSITATPTPTTIAWAIAPQIFEEDHPELHYSIAATRPMLEPQTEANAWINQAINDLLDAEYSGFQDMAESFAFDQEFPGHLWIGYSVPSSGLDPASQVVGVSESDLPVPLPADQAVLHLGHDLLSILFAVSPYTGGAHPGFYTQPLNLDLTTGQQLQLADLFLPGSDYLGVLSTLAIQQLQGRDSIFPDVLASTPYPGPEGGPDPQGFGAGPDPVNYRVWALSPAGLWVVFDPYQVAAWAAGPQYVLIPYDALAEIIDPAGPLGAVSP